MVVGRLFSTPNGHHDHHVAMQEIKLNVSRKEGISAVRKLGTFTSLNE